MAAADPALKLSEHTVPHWSLRYTSTTPLVRFTLVLPLRYSCMSPLLWAAGKRERERRAEEGRRKEGERGRGRVEEGRREKEEREGEL